MPITFNYGAPSQYIDLARDRQNLYLRKRAMDEQALARQQQASQQQASMMGNMLVQPMWQMAIQQRGFDQQQAMLQQQLQTQPQLWRDQAAIQQGFQDWNALAQAAAADPNAGGDVNRFLTERAVEQQRQMEGVRNPFGPYGEFGALGMRPFGASPQWSGPAGVVPDDDATLFRNPPPQFREAVQQLLADEASITQGDYGPSEQMGMRQQLEDRRFNLTQQIRKARQESPRPTPGMMAQQQIVPLGQVFGPGYENVVGLLGPDGRIDTIKEINRGRRETPTAQDLAAMSPPEYEQFVEGRRREANAAVQMVQLPDGSNVAVINDGDSIRPIAQSAQLGMGDTTMTPAEVNRLHADALKYAQALADKEALQSDGEYMGKAQVTSEHYKLGLEQAMELRELLQRKLTPPPPPPPPPPPGAGAAPAEPGATQAAPPQPTQNIPLPPNVDAGLVMNYAQVLRSQNPPPALQAVTTQQDPTRRAIDIMRKMQQRYGNTPPAEWPPEDYALMVACQDILAGALANTSR